MPSLLACAAPVSAGGSAIARPIPRDAAVTTLPAYAPAIAPPAHPTTAPLRASARGPSPNGR